MARLAGFIPIIAMLALFYLMIFIPENKRKKQYAQMLGQLQVNDEIMTKGGIVGKVITIEEEFIIFETGPDRVRMKLTKNGIAAVLNKKEN